MFFPPWVGQAARARGWKLGDERCLGRGRTRNYMFAPLGYRDQGPRHQRGVESREQRRRERLATDGFAILEGSCLFA